MLRKLKKPYRFVSAFLYIFFFYAVWASWITVDGKSYGTIGYIMHVIKAGGVQSVAKGDEGLTVCFFMFFLPAIAGVLSILYAISKFIGYSSKLLHRIIVWSVFIYAVTVLILCPMTPKLWTWIMPLLCVFDFVISQYFDQSDELIRADLERKERHKREEEERKRRLDFPGRYSSYFVKVILKNVKYHLRNYVMLVISGTFFMLFLFLIFALQYTFGSVHTEELLIMGDGLQKILLEAMWVGLVLNTVLMSLSFSYYMRNKMREENVFIILGIRGKTLTNIMILEYIGCLACSILIGLVGGNMIYRIFAVALGKKLPVKASGLPLGYYAIILLIFASAALVAGAVNAEVYNHMRWEQQGFFKKKSRLPGKWYVLWALFALGAICIALRAFASRNKGESILYLFLFLWGVYLLIRFVKGRVLRRVREGTDYGRVFHQIPYLNAFKKNTNKLFLLCLVCFFVMYLFAVEFAGLAAAPAPDSREEYPYDFVCLAPRSEERLFEQIEKMDSVELYHYPMLSATVALADNQSQSVLGTFSSMLNGQFAKKILGQQVAVSESVYRKLKAYSGEQDAAPLKLEGERIHIVYQEDISVSAHPLDWLYPEMGPYIDFGDGKGKYQDVQSEERDMLFGMFEEGVEENIVVLSDEYFNSLYGRLTDEKAGQSELYLINVEKSDYTAVKKSLKEFEARHQYNKYGTADFHYLYERQQKIKDLETERYLKKVIWLFVLFMVGACGVYLLFVKFGFELDEIAARYRFLDCMGMREKELKATLRREMLPFWGVPLIVGGLSSVVFTFLTFHIRMYERAAIAGYLKYAIAIWLLYWGLQVLAYMIIRKMLLKAIYKTEGGKA